MTLPRNSSMAPTLSPVLPYAVAVLRLAVAEPDFGRSEIVTVMRRERVQ